MEVRKSPKLWQEITEYRKTNGKWSLLELNPITGRTHQLRVHCAHVGAPILGEPQYGTEASQTFSAGFGLASQLLCAKSVTFTHPVTDEILTITSTMDAKMK